MDCLNRTVILNISSNHGVPNLCISVGTLIKNPPCIIKATKISKHEYRRADNKHIIHILITKFKKKPIKQVYNSMITELGDSREEVYKSNRSWRNREIDHSGESLKCLKVAVGLDIPGNQGIPSDDVSSTHNAEHFEDIVVLGKGSGWGKARRVHIQEGIIDNPTRARGGIGIGAKKMRVKSFTSDEVVSEGTGFEGGREGVRIEASTRSGPHLSVQEESVKGHVVADEANDDGVPDNSGRARKGV
ncbi:hypothetical protein SESBI_42999 [Sesbania bispinosa]|nr:hypothetical protein SESBI_42999 [Sesbania bispinosa]